MPLEIKKLFNQSGLILDEVNPNISKKFGMSKPFGLLVTDVIDSSPADLAGIHNNDLILDINIVNGSMYGCNGKFSTYKHTLGQILKLTILRQNDSFDICINNLTLKENNSDYSLKFKDPKTLNFSKFSSNGFEIHYPTVWNKVILNNTESGYNGVKFNFFSNNTHDSLAGYVMMSVVDKKDRVQDFFKDPKIFPHQSNYELIDSIMSNFSNQKSSVGFNDWIEYDMENIHNMETAQEHSLLLDTQSTSVMNFSLISQSGELKVLKLVIPGKTQNGNFYFVVREEYFNDYLPTIAKMLTTLKFHDIQTYWDFENGFEISYPSDIFRIDKTNYSEQCYNCKTLEFTNITTKDLTNIDHKFPRLLLDVIPSGGDSNISKNDEGNLINELKGRYYNYKALGSNTTNEVLKVPTLRLSFCTSTHYMDP